MSDFIQQLRHWSYRCQYLGKRGTDPLKVMEDIIGVYSWHPSAALSLHTRLKSFTAKEFLALDRGKKAFRVPAMRLSIHMQPADMAFRIMKAVVPPADDKVWEKRYTAKMSAEDFRKWKKEILAVAKEPMSIADMKKQTDIPEDLLKSAVNYIGYMGEILRIGSESLRSNIISYVATEAWAGKKYFPVKESQEDALAWLVGEYLRAFGPARVKDFQWWAGVTATQAKAAIATQETVEMEGKYLLLAKDAKHFEDFKADKKDTLDLLPQWDSYTMGYAPDGRERFVSKDMQHHIYGDIGATGGNGMGTVLINGLAHGSWDTQMKGNKMNVRLKMFDKLPKKMEALVNKRLEEIAELLEAKSVATETIKLD